MKRFELPPADYPLCPNCLRLSDGPMELPCQPGPCVVCGGPAVRPAGPRYVVRAFEVYFERLEMAFSRANHGA